ncbi:MAG TPA: kelch repeat-containing protein [bacterium]|nr:kelch repeat-containing protein [bacterium]HQO34020.1 kelch repeat-containing protein [bacterium]HQP97284.1 kelch repeat-containing protein [bacterium]
MFSKNVFSFLSELGRMRMSSRCFRILAVLSILPVMGMPVAQAFQVDRGQPERSAMTAVVSDTWQALPAATNQPSARSGYSCIAVGNVIYIFGGVRVQGFGKMTVNAGPLLGDLWAYNESSNTFVELGSPPETPSLRQGACAIYAGGYIYQFGGLDQNNQPLNDLWRYDITSNTWLQIVPAGELPPPSPNAHAVLRGNRIVFIGVGETKTGTWTFDIDNNMWIQGENYPETAPVQEFATFSYAPLDLDSVQIWQVDVARQNIYTYDTNTQTWTQEQIPGQFPGSRIGTTFCQIEQKGYVFGGYSYPAFESLKETWEFDLNTLSWKKLADMPVTMLNPKAATVETLDGRKVIVFGNVVDESVGYVLQTCAYQPPAGALQVTLDPQGALDAGAQWRRGGTTEWHNSGDTEIGVPVGPQVLEFKRIIGWANPVNVNVMIQADQTVVTEGTYTIPSAVNPTIWLSY